MSRSDRRAIAEVEAACALDVMFNVDCEPTWNQTNLAWHDWRERAAHRNKRKAYRRQVRANGRPCGWGK